MRRAFAALLLSCACGRVPEAALRDEQARARRYRDAYETQAGELQALKARVAALEQRSCATGAITASQAAEVAAAAAR